MKAKGGLLHISCGKSPLVVNNRRNNFPQMVITALQGMEAGAERTVAANDLLGKSAMDMVAVLNTSAEETEHLKQEAEDYGMVMSNEAVAASAAFEDSLTRLSHTASGLKNRMIGELLSRITQITDGLADLLAGNEQAADELKNGVTSVIGTIRTLIPQFAELITSIAEAVLESAPEIIKALADGLLSAISELTPTLEKIVTKIIFSSFMVCDNYGKNYRRKVTKSGPVWVCNTFNSLGKSACASKQIPETILHQVMKP